MSDAIYDKLLDISNTLGEVKAGQARLETALDDMGRRMEVTEGLVKGHTDALNNGVRSEIRTLAGRLDSYVDKDREDTCFFLRWKREQEAKVESELKDEQAGRNRRRWDFRSALISGVILAVLASAIGVGQWALQRKIERQIKSLSVEQPEAK